MRTGITCAFVVLDLLVSASNAQEDQPFHTSYFADETSLSLSVPVAATSSDPEYNFDVQVALTERGPEGQIRFIDHSAHLAKVRCAAPKAVMIGQSEFMLSDSPEPGDWKQDLWRTFCLLPVS